MLGAPFGPVGFQAILFRCISAWAVVYIGYLLITAVIVVATYCARQSQTRVWLTSPFPLWRPRMHAQGAQPKSENLVDLVLGAALLPLFLACFLLFPLIGELIEPQPKGSIVLVIVCLVVVWGTFLGFLQWKIFLALKKRLAAASPFECWDCDALGNAMIAKISSARRVRLLVAQFATYRVAAKQS